ncbi:MAG: hypothetical protein IT355_06130 [Gemmatimonadaceae bacterium]|nr:hypothetical protein [Gemmatimonadaceae bacterium]
MRQQLETRLNDLRTELEAGRKLQHDLDLRQEELRQTMLRISGAIQVLSEMLAEQQAPAAGATTSPGEAAGS